MVEQAMLRQSTAAAANNGALSEDKPEFHSDCHSCEDCLLFRLSYLGTCIYKSAFENSKCAPLKISICPLKACLFSQKQNLWRGWGMKSGVIVVMGTPIRKHCERYFTNTIQHGVDVSLWVVLWHSDRWVGGKVAVALNTKRWHLFWKFQVWY